MGVIGLTYKGKGIGKRKGIGNCKRGGVWNE